MTLFLGTLLLVAVLPSSANGQTLESLLQMFRIRRSDDNEQPSAFSPRFNPYLIAHKFEGDISLTRFDDRSLDQRSLVRYGRPTGRLISQKFAAEKNHVSTTCAWNAKLLIGDLNLNLLCAFVSRSLDRHD